MAHHRHSRRRGAQVTSPAHRLAHALACLRGRRQARLTAAQEEEEHHPAAPSDAEGCIALLAAAYRRVGLDPKAQGAAEQTRVWAQACLGQGGRAAERWSLEDEEELALIRLLDVALQARMDGGTTAQELCLCPQEQTARLLQWRRCALPMCALSRDEQRHSSEWRRFGLELTGALEMGRRRDDWKPKSVRWLAAVSELVHFCAAHMEELWHGEVNGFGVLALLRNSPQRLAPVLARALPRLRAARARDNAAHYERGVVAILCSGQADAVELISQKLLDGPPLHPERDPKWLLRLQTHLVRFACPAGAEVVRAWLEMDGAVLLHAALSLRTQPLLKQLLSTQTSAPFPRLRASQRALAERLLTLAPPTSDAGRTLLGLNARPSRMEPSLAKCLRALLESPEGAAQKLRPLDLGKCDGEEEEEAPLQLAPRRADVLEFVVAHGRAADADFAHLMPEDPTEEPGPEAAAFSMDGVVEAITYLCGSAPEALCGGAAQAEEPRPRALADAVSTSSGSTTPGSSPSAGAAAPPVAWAAPPLQPHAGGSVCWAPQPLPSAPAQVCVWGPLPDGSMAQWWYCVVPVVATLPPMDSTAHQRGCGDCHDAEKKMSLVTN